MTARKNGTSTTGSARSPGLRRGLWLVLALAAAAVLAVAWLASRPSAVTVAPAGSSASSSAPPAETAPPSPAYVGTAACASCHAKEHQAWQGSQHDRAMAEANEATVLGNFAGAKFSHGGVTSTFFRRDGRFFVNTDGPDGRLADFEIRYTFGVTPLQQYLVEMPGGRLQALGIAWDARPAKTGGQRWFHLYPDRTLKAGDPLHWTGIDQTWNYQCADCHSTNLRKNYDEKTDRYATTWTDVDVGCEACHGPGSNHVAWAKKEGDGQRHQADKGLTVVLDERRGVGWAIDAATGNAARSRPRETSREIETCARCHARRGQFTDAWHAGNRLADGYRAALIEPGLYWDDGQQRDEVFNHGSFLGSRMHARGVTCSDCHDPHSGRTRAGQRGLRAMPPAGEVRHRVPSSPRAGFERGRVHRLPHADHDLHGRRPAPRSRLPRPATGPHREPRHAERLQSVSYGQEARVGGGRHQVLVSASEARLPDLRRGVCAGRARRTGRAAGARGGGGGPRVVRLRSSRCDPAARPVPESRDAAYHPHGARRCGFAGARRRGRGSPWRGRRPARPVAAGTSRRSGAPGQDGRGARARRRTGIAPAAAGARPVLVGARRVRRGGTLQRRPARRPRQPRQPARGAGTVRRGRGGFPRRARARPELRAGGVEPGRPVSQPRA
ncbi:MAG: hypothetical protein IPM30_06540 [Burkholderiales bacterium]|nr:hypothetical protein [Burkholderiales bacterium]